MVKYLATHRYLKDGHSEDIRNPLKIIFVS